MSHDLLTGTTLRQRARRALADDGLQRALDAVTDRLAGARRTAAAELTNHEELRTAARAMRAEVLGRLPELLDQLATNWERHGGTVFFAADAAEATDHVRAIALRTGARLAVKSKSMLTEEIALNDALEAAGVETVETDLGEWIIQLAHQPPSHIIAPAIHLDRRDIRALFERVRTEGSVPLSDVPADLTAFARAQLRQRFLDADLGITGCNFGVAETGSMVLVTNEGNGRMVTSVPRVHVALMGMERVVATWEQLDLLLHLLPRAATGQDTSVYVNHLTGPRRAGEVDGPDELHLVIVDNGRSDLLGSELQEMLNCIRCGACLNACPVYRQIGGHAYGWAYSGPMGAVLIPLLHGAPEAAELSQASSLCAACHHACPVGIPLQDLLLGLRRRGAEESGDPLERAAWSAWAASWSRPAAYRASTRLAGSLGRVLPEGLFPSAWTAGRALPRPPAGASFRQRFARGEL